MITIKSYYIYDYILHTYIMIICLHGTHGGFLQIYGTGTSHCCKKSQHNFGLKWWNEGGFFSLLKELHIFLIIESLESQAICPQIQSISFIIL